MVVVLHIASTYGIGIVRAAKARQLGLRVATFWLGSSVIVVASALAAYLLRDVLDRLVPPPAEMMAALWTGLFASAIAVAAIRTMTVEPIDTSALLARSETEIPRELFEYAQELSAKHDADYVLVRAVMLTENLQRPPWLRSVERFKGRFFRRGTYGIMQVSADRPLSDRESIEVAVRNHFAGTALIPNENMWPRVDLFSDVLKTYNSNPDFIALAHVAMHVGEVL
jgi:hypothetical protein